MKKCRKCGVELVPGENWWASCVKKHDYICIKCIKATQLQYAKEHREEKAAYDRQYNKEHKEERAAYSRQYYEKHKEKIAAYKRQWEQENKERIKAKKREYYLAHHEERLEKGRQYRKDNRDKCRAVTKRWAEANPERVKENSARYYRANIEEHRERSRQWVKDNPERAREMARQRRHRRRARKLNASIGPVDEVAIYELYESACLYCGATNDLTIDHIVPLAGGGAHSENNLVVACGSCNYSKGAKPLEDWLQTQPRANAWVY